MKVVYKYEIGDLKGDKKISLPVGAKVVAAGLQRGTFFIWAIVDTEAPYTEERRFAVIGTGWEIQHECWQYIGIIHDGPFVWHVMEVLDVE